MDLFTIQHEVIGSGQATDWYRVNLDGPSFHYRWQYGTGPDGPFSYIMDEHREHAVLRADPSLTMSWGMDVYEFNRAFELQFEWATAFVDETVRPFWVDFFWNNALIDRVTLYRVDGGRGVIPPPPDPQMEVSEFDRAVAWLVHDLSAGDDGDPDHYLAAISATRGRDTARGGAGSH